MLKDLDKLGSNKSKLVDKVRRSFENLMKDIDDMLARRLTLLICRTSACRHMSNVNTTIILATSFLIQNPTMSQTNE